MTHTARALITSLDEIVWAVDPENDSLENLAGYVCRYAGEFFENCAVTCDFAIPPKLPDCRVPSDVRHNVFLAVKEALHNVLKHSQASRVQLRLAADADRLTIVIADDGRGFAAAPAARPNGAPAGASKRRGHGLTNIRERLAGVGGQCQVTSVPGGGTRIEFAVPLSWKRPG
jgi:signal transduction histidine kinase